jgi:hypothetical protein
MPCLTEHAMMYPYLSVAYSVVKEEKRRMSLLLYELYLTFWPKCEA